MKTERIKVLQYREDRGKGFIIGDDLKQYVFILKDVKPEIIEKLKVKGTVVELVVLEDKTPSIIKEIRIITHQTKSAKQSFKQESSPRFRQANSDSGETKGNPTKENELTNKRMPEYLPRDTRESIENFKTAEISNYALMLNKYPLVIEDRFCFFRGDSRKEPGLYNYNHTFSQIDFDILAMRKENSIKALGMKTQSLIMEPEWRMVVGLGGASVYETSLTLHHVYGIPYIPGSALKGVTRSWVITNCFEGNESEALKDKGFTLIFGSTKSRGKVYFYDAFPLDKPKLKVDVMTPHYSDYYSKGMPPGDYESPNPIPFITIEKTKFKIIIGINAKDNVTIDAGYFSGQNVLDVVKEWVFKALQEHGIGAKTTVGYGIMKKC